MSEAAAEPVVVFAAGSLRAPLTAIGHEFETKTGTPVRFEFGASGLLKDRILAGEAAQVFASANTEHPRALAQAGKAEPEEVFTHNQLCALAGPNVRTSPTELLSLMLEERVKLGTSTPKADPSGDYAWEVFRKADTVRPGSFRILSAKALQLTGGPNSPSAPPERNLYGILMAEGRADVFLTYCTSAVAAAKEQPRLRVVSLPPELAVGAEYGVTVLKGSPAASYRFVEFLRGPAGQMILSKYGFQ